MTDDLFRRTIARRCRPLVGLALALVMAGLAALGLTKMAMAQALDSPEMERAMQLLNEGETAKARALLEVEARTKSNSVALVYLVAMAEAGWGEPEDAKRAEQLKAEGVQTMGGRFMLVLAAHYDEGNIFRKNPRAAVAWVRRAVDEDYAPAKRVLGRMHWIGLPEADVPMDRERALALLRAASDGQDPVASHLLAGLLREGIHIPKDSVTARRLYLHAAELGDISSYLPLAWMIARAEGGSFDAEAARRWALRALQEKPVSYSDAYRILAMVVEANAPADESTARDAMEYLEKGAFECNPWAQLELSKRLLIGLGHARDVVSSKAWGYVAWKAGVAEAADYADPVAFDDSVRNRVAELNRSLPCKAPL